MVMAGVMATAGKWAQYEREFDRIKRENGIDVLHTKSLKRSDRLIDVGLKITDALIDHKCTGIVFELDNKAFEEGYKAGPPPKKIRLDTAYAFCFRYCLYQFLREVEGRYGQHKKFSNTRLHIVMESGHRHAGDAARVFDEVQKEARAAGSELLASLIFAPKESSGALMTSDFLANTSYQTSASRGLREVPGQDRSTYKGRPGIIHLQVQPGKFADLRAAFIGQMQAVRTRFKPSLSGPPGSEVRQ